MDFLNNKDLFYVIFLIVMAPLFGATIKDASHTVEESLKVGDKKWLWGTMMFIVFFVAIICGWSNSFSLSRLCISIVAWPILGYLMMLGALKSKSKLSWSFRKK